MSFTPPGMNPNAGMSEQEAQMVKMMQSTMESCAGKTVMAGVMGGGLGAMFGLFMSSMRYDTPMSQPLAVPNAPAAPSTTTTTTTTTTTATASQPAKPTSTPTSAAPSSSSTAKISAPHPSLQGQMVSTPNGSIPLTDLPLKQQLKHGLRDMYRSSISSGKNFAKVGAIFSGTECAIEGLRAKNDLWNGVAGGCITGGVLARNAGPQAAAVGCAGFAAFSAAIDAYMVSGRPFEGERESEAERFAWVGSVVVGERIWKPSELFPRAYVKERVLSADEWTENARG